MSNVRLMLVTEDGQVLGQTDLVTSEEWDAARTNPAASWALLSELPTSKEVW